MKVSEMDITIYDFEVFHSDWIVVFFEPKTGEIKVYHNDPTSVAYFCESDPILCGFNVKGYDQFILKGVIGGLDPQEVKEINDFIIEGGRGWDYPPLKEVKTPYITQVDLMDDMQDGLSLKAIEGHMGMNIRESGVDFTIERALTAEELEEAIHYCTADVMATYELFKLRENYLQTKLDLGELAGIEPRKALYMTNAKLTAAFLQAKPPMNDWTDERQYKFPEKLLKEFIPEEVMKFFEDIHDESIPSDEYFKRKLQINVGGCPVTIAFGGIHGAIKNYQEQETNTRIIRNYDVASYYPHLMTLMGYTSRNIPDPKIYEDMLEKRMAAKKAGDKVTANALKLVANTTYGASLNRFNDLFDPLMGRSVCITGQLFLLELSNHLLDACETVRIIQVNTDGVMFSFDKNEYPIVKHVTEEWQIRTGFELEEDQIHRIIQKDVNNYIEIPCGENPKPKIKGGYLVKGIAPAGAFNINNNAKCIAKAIYEYFVNGVPVEDTINQDEDILDFQLIAKAGSKYKDAYHEVGDEHRAIQKVNRVYATDNPYFGKLVKVHAKTDAEGNIPSLPDHCLIDNDNHLTIKDVYKGWYIELAKKQVNDYLGIKPEKKGRTKKMAVAKTAAPETPKNIYQKLMDARVKFLEKGIKKSGVNMSLEYSYFELADIVPTAMGIFNEVGLIPLFNTNRETATLEIVEIADPASCIMFQMPYKEMEGNRGTNAMQALGASQTYLRRYLYMAALDIIEPDTVESKATDKPDDSPKPIPVAPATPQKREEVTAELTKTDAPADALQVKQLKALLKKLKESDPTKNEYVAEIAVGTKAFKEISKEVCAELISQVKDMIKEVSK